LSRSAAEEALARVYGELEGNAWKCSRLTLLRFRDSWNSARKERACMCMYVIWCDVT
jgi:hypothetical protein